MILASAVVKRQLTVEQAALPGGNPAAGGVNASHGFCEALTRKDANLNLSRFEPRGMFGEMVDIEVVHDQYDLFRVRAMNIYQLFEEQGEINSSAGLRHLHDPLGRQRLKRHEQVYDAATPVLTSSRQ